MASPPSDSYRTVLVISEYEPDKTKGSRHIAQVVPVRSGDEIAAGLAAIRAQRVDANHHAWAWRLGRGRDHFRYSDDGEPSGSAGRPILQQIDGRALTDVLVVVSRYFGGTKLGVGGVMRAYGGAAAAALDRAEVCEVVPQAHVSVQHGYEDSGAIAGVLSAFVLAPQDAVYGTAVQFAVLVPQVRADELVRALRDATAGRAAITVRDSDRAT